MAGAEAISRARGCSQTARRTRLPRPMCFVRSPSELARLGGRDAASDALDAIGSPRVRRRGLWWRLPWLEQVIRPVRATLLSLPESASAIGDPEIGPCH